MKNALMTGSICVLLVLASCSKKDDPAASSSSVLVNSKGWKVTAETVTPAYMGTNDFFSVFPDCVKDDVFKFKSDGTYTEDEGATKCSSTDPQTADSGTWSLNSDKTIITITPTGKSAVTYNVNTLTSSTIVSKTVENHGGTDYTFTITFTAIQ